MERRPRKGFSRLDRKKSSESATQQYKVADIDPHNYDVFETRHKQYPAKLTRSGQNGVSNLKQDLLLCLLKIQVI